MGIDLLWVPVQNLFWWVCMRTPHPVAADGTSHQGEWSGIEGTGGEKVHSLQGIQIHLFASLHANKNQRDGQTFPQTHLLIRDSR